jgi:transcriptional regulator with XRE-family HTH domain
MTDPRALALRLRTVDGLSARQIGERLGIPARTVARWLHGVPVPAWTKRPNAKDDLRERAVALRAAGWSVPDLARELGVARSTAWLWVRDQPLDMSGKRALAGAERRRRAVLEFWAGRNEATDAERQEVQAQAAARVGELGDAELLRAGALIYWCEGTKAKPWASKSEQVQFTNSDPGLIVLFLRFLAAAEVPLENRRFRLAIHESADVEAALRWWADFVGVEPDSFMKTTLKRHNPATRRHNTAETYRGCLVVSVVKCRRLYWLIEGIVMATVNSAPVSASTADGEFDTLTRNDRP